MPKCMYIYRTSSSSQGSQAYEVDQYNLFLFLLEEYI